MKTNEIIDQVLEIVNTNIEQTEIVQNQIHEDLTQLGMDSLAFIKIVVEIEDQFQIEIPDEYLLMTEMCTISKIVNVIQDKISREL